MSRVIIWILFLFLFMDLFHGIEFAAKRNWSAGRKLMIYVAATVVYLCYWKAGTSILYGQGVIRDSLVAGGVLCLASLLAMHDKGMG